MGRKRAFVTGGTGFVGANLVRELAAQGWEVTVFHRQGSDLWRLKGLKLNLKVGSFKDPASLETAIPEGVDAVFHLAARVSFWRGDDGLMEQDNVEATKTIIEAALRRKVRRFIHTSTVSVYGFSDKRIDEEAPHKGLTSNIGYLRTKARAEQVVREGILGGLDAVILNPSNVIGPLDRDHMGVSMQKVKAGKMPGAPPGRTSFAHSVEVAKAHIAAFEKGRKGENYILAGTDASFAEAFSTIEEVVGVPHKVKPLPGILLRIFGEVAQLASTITKKAPFVTPELVQWLCGNFSYDSGKAVKELGYQPRPLKEMLKDLWDSLPEKNS